MDFIDESRSPFQDFSMSYPVPRKSREIKIWNLTNNLYIRVSMIENPPKKRRGPLTKFPQGRYINCRIGEVIEKDPRYIMVQVKEWLNLSPSQAEKFQQVTGGSIPEKYIVSPPKRESPSIIKVPSIEQDKSPKPDIDWTYEDDMVDIFRIPLYYDQEPEIAPPWWREFRQKTLNIKRPSILFKMYKEYEDKWLKGTL